MNYTRLAKETWRQLPNQDLTPLRTGQATLVFLPVLLKAWHDVEKATGHAWRATSFIRISPSHKRGVSLDIAPSISANSWARYSLSNLSDPVLYKREPLIRALQEMHRTFKPLHGMRVGLYIEPDHIHIQVFNDKPGGYSVIKFKVPKSVYHDTTERMKLPMTRSGY